MNDLPKPRTMDEYLATLPEDQQIALDGLRFVIKSVDSRLEEAINYAMPMFRFHGMLVGFAAAKKHLGFYVCSYRTIGLFKNELTELGLDWSGITIRFQPENPLPDDLVERIVRARMAENGVKATAKKK